MARMIKWTLIGLLVLTIGYSGHFLANLTDEQKGLIKQGAVESLEGGSLKALVTPISLLVKADLGQKKDRLWEGLRLRAKKTLSDVLDDEQRGEPKATGDLQR